MKITYSAIINNLSGRSGGVVFSRWQGVRVGRIFTPPTQPRTSNQVGHRNLFRWLNRMYKLVNNSWQLESWKRAAEGRPGIARNFFMASNLTAIGSETDDNSFVPFYLQPTPASAWVGGSATGQSGAISLSWTTAPTPSTTGIERSRIVACVWGAAAPRQASPSAILKTADFSESAVTGSIDGLTAGTYSIIICIAYGPADNSSASESMLAVPTSRLTATVT